MSKGLVNQVLSDISELCAESIDLEDFLENLSDYQEEVSQSLEGLGDDAATGAAAGVAGGAVLAGAGAYGIHRAKNAVGAAAKKAATHVAIAGAVGGGAFGLHHFLKGNGASEAHQQAGKEADSHVAKAEAHAEAAHGAQTGVDLSHHAEEVRGHLQVAHNLVDHLHTHGVLNDKAHGYFKGKLDTVGKHVGNVFNWAKKIVHR